MAEALVFSDRESTGSWICSERSLSRKLTPIGGARVSK
jgi:hypothetical protein